MKKIKKNRTKLPRAAVSLWPGIAGLLCLPVAAQDATSTPADGAEASPVVVTATRVEQSSFDLPVAIDARNREQIQDVGKPQINISEQLNQVPGTVVQNRDSYAQEQQIIIRGFGARSGFGTRGVKLLADGIPASTPDGQGGPGLFDLDSAARIEVLRGPFSALYGNHSGGVVQVFTEDGPPQPTLSVTGLGGSWGTWKAGAKFGGTSDALNYIGSLSTFHTEGYREHSAAQKDQFNAKLDYSLSGGDSLSFVVNYLNQDDNEDPLGLTAAQVAQDPGQAGDNAIAFNTGRSLQNLQGGIVYENRLSDADTLRAIAYVGNRTNLGSLAIPLPQQNGVRNAGGVPDLDRMFGGLGIRWTRQTALANGPLTFTTGVDYDRADEDRKGYQNLLGVQGALKRDEQNVVDSWGGYVQGEWRINDPWSVSLGLRYTEVAFDSSDNFVCTNTVNTTGTALGTCSGTTNAVTANPTTWNPDDSGSKTYSAWTPVGGAVFRVTPALNLYGNIGQSFETPTFIELAYRPDGTSGLNFDLEPALSNHYELGVKAFLAGDTRLNVSVFQIDTQDEIVVATNAGGRATYRNAGDTQRRGIELLVDSRFPGGFGGYVAATYMDATFSDGFLACSAPPCTTPSVPVNAGNSIPGIPTYQVYAELNWRHASGFTAAAEGGWRSKVYVNDVNSESADAFFVLNLRAGYQRMIGAWKLGAFVRVDNVLNEQYIGGVVVNDSNGRFYAPAPTSTLLVSATAGYQF